MFSAARRWLRNNRTPLAVGIGVIGAGYLAAQYIVAKISDARERMSSERIAKDNLRRRFEQNQEDCTFTVLALLPTATANVLSVLNTEKITYEIQQTKTSARGAKSDSANPPSIADTTLTEDDGKSMASMHSESGIHVSQIATSTSSPSPSPFAVSTDSSAHDGRAPKTRKTKRQLWDDLAISAATRAFTLVYTLALLVMLTRIQLNLLGRRSYLSSVVSLAAGAQHTPISLENKDDDKTDEYGCDFDTNRKYLTFSWWLLNRGWVELMHRVESAVRTVFGGLSPRDLVTFQRYCELTMEVRKLVEGATPEERRNSDWLRFVLPRPELEAEVIRESGILDDNASQGGDSQPSSPALRRLLDETADIVESPAFVHVLTLVLDSAFSLLVDNKLAVEAYETADEQAREQLRSKAVLLPKILSVLTRQAHVIGNGMPNEYLQEMETVRELESFAAVVYSSNWENEMRDEDVEDVAAKLRSAIRGQSGHGEESLVMVDPESSFESAWERALDKR
ncbi:Peroxin-3 family protein [Ophiocordyceps camponoti-floridani]|uniref:Peroxin-3 family protein n=1 Tax=Ophiocordyceps camponoti-floridani TaxID=2030778 RepID=A0A8H4Q4V7_9HYPO|nr:Peroxin-3 family protein [Ophiocordyceps camponoti-floridani]